MARILVLNRYRCQHVEPFRLGKDEVHLLSDYLHIDEETGKKCFTANSIECHECYVSSYVTMERPGSVSLDPNSSQSALPPRLDPHDWYMDLMNERRDEDRGVTPKEGRRLLGIFARDVVYLYQPSEIQRFFRHVYATHDMTDKAELGEAIMRAITNKIIQQRASFWDELGDAFQVAYLGRPTYQGSAESECSKTIHRLMLQLREETNLLSLLACEYPTGTTIPPSVVEARNKLSEHQPIITNTISALNKVLENAQVLNLDTNDISQHSDISNFVATGRFLTIVLYQLYSRQRSILRQLVMQKKR